MGAGDVFLKIQNLFSIVGCLAKPDNILTEEIKYRYKLAIFYRFLPIPIFELLTLSIPIRIFAFE